MKMFKRACEVLQCFCIVMTTFIRCSAAEDMADRGTSKSGAALRIRIVVPSVCRLGDMDVVAQEQMFADKKKESKILLSLSSLDGKEEYTTEIFDEFKEREFLLDPHSFISKFVRTERETTINVGQPHKSGVFAVAVCKDTTGRNSCQQDSEERYSDLMDILRSYSTKREASFVSNDSVYYYQLIYLGPKGVSLAAAPLHSDKGLDAFAKKHSIDQSTKAIQRNRLRKTFSVPPEVQQGTLVIKLPLYDSKRCG